MYIQNCYKKTIFLFFVPKKEKIKGKDKFKYILYYVFIVKNSDNFGIWVKNSCFCYNN